MNSLTQKTQKMKKTLMILMLIPIGVSFIGCKKANVSATEQTTEQVAQLNLQVSQLSFENQYLKNEVAKQDQEVSFLRQMLIDCEASKQMSVSSSVTRPRTTTTTRAAAPAAPATTSRAPVQQTTTAPKTTRVGVANLSYLRQNGEIIFCVTTNGREDRYFPHFAIERGVTFVGTTDNSVKGYNWKVEPTEFMEGDYGVTTSGTFYVSDRLLRTTLQAAGENLQDVEIKCPYTRWAKKPMTLDQASGYWVFHTQQ